MPMRILFSAEQISAKVDELAARIREDYPDGNVVLVGILKGSIHFHSDLGRAIGGASMLDFIQTSSYGAGRSSSGVVEIRKDVSINVEGLDVLLVEDIVDSGLTLSHVRNFVLNKGVRSVRIVTLLSKPDARVVDVPVDYVGFEIPNDFVVGYGLDDNEQFRNLSYIGVVE